MPFNSRTYHANRWRRVADKQLAEAREHKARIDAGQGSDHDRTMLPLLAKSAVAYARLSRQIRKPS